MSQGALSSSVSGSIASASVAFLLSSTRPRRRQARGLRWRNHENGNDEIRAVGRHTIAMGDGMARLSPCVGNRSVRSRRLTVVPRGGLYRQFYSHCSAVGVGADFHEAAQQPNSLPDPGDSDTGQRPTTVQLL